MIGNVINMILTIAFLVVFGFAVFGNFEVDNNSLTGWVALIFTFYWWDRIKTP